MIALEENPDERSERYNGSGGKRAATTQEIAAYDDEKKDQRVAAFVAENKELVATLLLVRQYCNALLAGTYTNKSVANVKADFITVWKALP